MIDDFLEIYKELSNIPSVTNFEKPLYEYIKNKFVFDKYEKLCDADYIAFLPEKYEGDMLISIHIDRLGIVFDKYFKYSNYYGYELINKKYKSNLMFGERFVGEKVIACDIVGEKIDEGEVTDCWINDDEELEFEIVGLNSNELHTPTPIPYKNNLMISDDELKGQIDNDISVALAYLLLNDGIDCPILFTTQEEIGKSWEFIYNFMEKQKLNTLITIDTTDVEKLSNFDCTDIVFRTSDDLADFNNVIIKNFIDLSKRKKLRYYLKSRSPEQSKIKTITEVGHIIKESGKKFTGASIQFPTINYHTNHETVKIKSINSIYYFIKDYFNI